jgi:NADH-quinone oxidoreductase subunit F
MDHLSAFTETPGPTETDFNRLHLALTDLAPLGRSGLLPALHAAQSLYGYLPEPVVTEVARVLSVPLADVHGVVEFYTLFHNQPTPRRILRLCTDPACALQGAEQTLASISNHLESGATKTTSNDAWTVERTTCLGLCARAPAASLSIPVADLSPARQAVPMPHSISFTMPGGSPDRLLAALEMGDLPAGQDHIGGGPRLLTALCGGSREATLSEYEAAGGMQALRRWIGEVRSPQDLIVEIKASGLVGMGGAAFPTGIKWQGAAEAAGEAKYFVINVDESEPGTFKDRVLTEGDPCRVLEGAILGAYAIGASKAYAFVRGEYPLAVERLQAAVHELALAGYLGADILGSGYSLDLEIRVGAGAYICGEETALFAAIEGERGFPRIKPPFPTTHGLFGLPTAINNVETLAKVPYILTHGAEVYRQLGTERSPGTKLFCLSGDVFQPGLYEVPFGASLRRLLYDLAGGVKGELQAVLFGGAAGAFAGPESLDVRLTFEDLRNAGLPLGSGVVMVFNQQRDLRDVLLRLAHFFAHESCGKCYPCQLGTQRQVEILERFLHGKPLRGDKARLADVGWTMTDASLCGLGQTAASAVLSAMRLWPPLFREAAAARTEPEP